MEQPPEPSRNAPALGASPLKIREFRNLLPISVVVALGFGMITPILPDYARDFGVSLAAVGLVQALFGFTRFGSGLIGGLFVDRFGERQSTIAGLLIVAVSSYAAGFATSFPQLLIARGLGGGGSALFIAGLMNRIIKVVEPRSMGRATGAFRAAFLVGGAGGPALGGFVGEHFGTAAPFHFYATGLLIATVITYFAMPAHTPGEGAQRRSPRDALRAARPLLKDIRYVVALLATLTAWWTLAGPGQTLVAIFAEDELGFSKSRLGVGITLVAIGELVILLIAGRLSDRVGRRAVLIPSLIVAGVATVAIGMIDENTAWALFPAMIVMGMGVAAMSTAGGGLLGDSVPREGSGAAVGVNQMAGDAGYIVSQAALPAVADGGGFPLAYALSAIPAAATLVVATRLPKEPPAASRHAAEPDAIPQPEPHEPVG
jgi:MFS transporter, DHA1 family, multidrug resistance protein